MRIYLGLVLAMFVSSGNVFGDEGCYGENDDNIRIGECLRADLRGADRELSVTLETLKKGFWDAESLGRLNQAQAAWNEFVDLDCKFQKPQTGGREWWFGHAFCILEHKRDASGSSKQLHRVATDAFGKGRIELA